MNNSATTILYDQENRILTDAGITYTYNGDGERVAKSSGKLYWGKGPLAETDASGNITAEYIFLNGQRIARRDADGSVHYYFSDHLGSHSVIENATGTNCEQDMDYYPYGGVANDYCSSTSVPQNYKFTGKERDSESGNDYFGARYYASSMGRCLSPDWAAKATPVPYAKLSDPQTLNLYAYVGNNPLTRFDADGHTITCTGDQCKQYIAALQKATGMTFAADKNGLLSITSRPDKMGYVGSAVAGVIGDKKNAVNISADSHNDVLGGHYAGHGNQILNFNSINALSSAKGGFTPQSIVTHETMEAYVGLKLGGAYDMATYSKAHAAAIGYENAERLSEGLPARIDEYGSGSNGTFHGTVNFSFWKEHFDVTNGTSVSNVTSERTNQPGQTIQ
ncbi:MAG: RHS repeat-associated core domain-containing protein [Terriglobales bacterium]|jgi:RHS repeat-associated protein